MKFKAATCEKCGAPLSFDNTQQVLFCEHCGSSYLIENDERDEQVEALKRAEQWLRMKNWQKAEEVYLQVIETFPTNAGAWYGALRALTRDFSNTWYIPQNIDKIARYYHGFTMAGGSGEQLHTITSYADWLTGTLKQLREDIMKNGDDYRREIGAMPISNIDKTIKVCSTILQD